MNNWMTYITGDIPVGAYTQIAWPISALDMGPSTPAAGYTYFDLQTGHELSAVLGFTYNFMNEHTHYQNGVDMHLDWEASQFLTKQLQMVQSATSTTNSRATPGAVISLAASTPTPPASGRRSATSFRWGMCRAM